MNVYSIHKLGIRFALK